MKRKFLKSLFAGFVGLLSLTFVISCTDEWDNHYDATSTASYDGSLMEYLQSIPELSDFCEVVKAAGYDKELSENQVMTVMAPKNGTFDKAYYLDLINDGKTDKVIEEFIKNHICRYNLSMTDEEQKVLMLNEKIVNIGTKADAKIEGINVSQMNVSCNNGVVHVLDAQIPYAFNIYEYVADVFSRYEESELTGMDETMYEYLSKMQKDSLDERHSVSHGFDENGNRIWVDSVVIRNNRLLSALDAYIYREDSTYLTILPSPSAYNDRVEGIKDLFKFNVVLNSEQAVRDSLQRYWAHYYALCDLTYNLHMNNIDDPTLLENSAEIDTVFSTSYRRWEWPYNVYHWPFLTEKPVVEEEPAEEPGEEPRIDFDSVEWYGDENTDPVVPTHDEEDEGVLPESKWPGIFSIFTDRVKCSNGWVYTMDQIPFSVFDNVFKKITLEGESMHQIYYDGDEKFTNTKTTSLSRVNNPADTISGNAYLHVVPASTSRNTEFTYYLPNTLSGAYDIYVKFLPLQVFDETKVRRPVQFRASIFERKENGSFPDEGSPTYEFYNGTSKNFNTDPDHIDSLYIGTYKFANCYLNTSPGVMFKLESYVLTSQAQRFTKEMLIDKVVLIPNRKMHDVNGKYIGGQ